MASWLYRILPSSGASPPATDCAAAARHCLATKVGTLTSQTFLPACPVSSGLAAMARCKGQQALSASSTQRCGRHVRCRSTSRASRRIVSERDLLKYALFFRPAGGGDRLRLRLARKEVE